jgi:hypothetical protein
MAGRYPGSLGLTCPLPCNNTPRHQSWPQKASSPATTSPGINLGLTCLLPCPRHQSWPHMPPPLQQHPQASILASHASSPATLSLGITHHHHCHRTRLPMALRSWAFHALQWELARSCWACNVVVGSREMGGCLEAEGTRLFPWRGVYGGWG